MPSRKRVGFQVFTLVLLAGTCAAPTGFLYLQFLVGIVPLIVGYAIIAGVEPKIYLLEQDSQPFWTLFAISVAQFCLYLGKDLELFRQYISFIILVTGWIIRPHPVMYIICFVFCQLNLIFSGAVCKFSSP